MKIWVWRRSDLVAVLDYARDKTYEGSVCPPDRVTAPTGSYDYTDYIHFSDGASAAVRSSWSGPLSEVTPDIDCEPPSIWLGRWANIDREDDFLLAGLASVVPDGGTLTVP